MRILYESKVSMVTADDLEKFREIDMGMHCIIYTSGGVCHGKEKTGRSNDGQAL